MTPIHPDCETDDLDWSSVLLRPRLSLSVQYVLILDWLPDTLDELTERQTGQALAAWLTEKYGPQAVRHRRCQCVADIRRCLEEATRLAASGVNPVVHIEAHGGRNGFVGPDGTGGYASISWAELGALLRPLNIATRFNLLLVGAACYAEGLLLAIEGGQPMPFVAVVGFTETVSAASLFDEMKELYRQLANRQELGAATEEADRQHRFPEDAVLRHTPATILALESFIDAARERVGIDTRDGHALDVATDVLRANGYDLSALPYTTLKLSGAALLANSLRDAWAIFWMTDTFPENATRFALDFEAAAAMATQLNGARRVAAAEAPNASNEN